ncbi:hypothetical protein GOBAR_DD02441 [Gossypium barbadense]|nr:hypothetical protein GOBAR_DD02441 [Gossypium barbadense]
MVISFESVAFSHVWREQNEAAHSKAMEGRRLAVDSYWIEEAPEMVEKVVEKDMLSLRLQSEAVTLHGWFSGESVGFPVGGF